MHDRTALAYSCYLDLVRAANTGGSLALYCGLDGAGCAIAAAANIAGAASLGLDADAARVREALREGMIDVMVHSLNEALRILKNEVRKKLAVSVAVVNDPAACLAEMVERGVQPDVLAGSAADPGLLSRGARLLVPAPAAGSAREVRWLAAGAQQPLISAADRIAAEVVQQDPARRHWVLSGPKYLGRSRRAERYLRLTGDEL